MENKGFTTQRVHAERKLNDPPHGAVHEPISTSVLFDYADAQQLIDVFQGKQPGHVYSRSSSGSVNALQNVLNGMEQGSGAVCFATGMAAISSSLLALLKQGDHLIVSRFLFGNTKSFFSSFTELGIEISFVDVTDVQEVKTAIQPNTRGVFTETIANPVTQIADIDALSRLCAEHALLFMVDGTMTPSPLFKAKQAGVSLLFCSLTKYIGGHGNALGGAVIDCGNYDWTQYSNIRKRYQTEDKSQWGLTQIRKLGLRDLGATLAPGSAHTLSAGLETLALRMEKACDNAMALATWLTTDARVKTVYYPGLASHPQHQRARALFTQYGAIFSFELKEGFDAVEFLNAMKLVVCATHLGDTRTLALPVAPTIFFESSAHERQLMGIGDTMIRVSVGIEDTDDLVEDFKQALRAVSNEPTN